VKAWIIVAVLSAVGCHSVPHNLVKAASLSIELIDCEEMSTEGRTPKCDVCSMSGMVSPPTARQQNIGAAVSQAILDRYYRDDTFGDSMAVAKDDETAVYVVSPSPLRLPPATTVPFRPATSLKVAINEATRLDKKVGFVEFEVGEGDDKGDFWVSQSDGFVTNRTVPGGILADHYDAVATGIVSHCVREEGGRLKVFRTSTIVVGVISPPNARWRFSLAGAPSRTRTWSFSTGSRPLSAHPHLHLQGELSHATLAQGGGEP
jgi:hypothetical protein